jgi:hypothetical protein
VFADIRSNPADPPDVLFAYDGAERGLELAELLPERRLEKDKIISKLRRDIISHLRLSEKSRGFVVNISLRDDYAAKLRPGQIDRALADTLNEFFDREGKKATIIAVPERLQAIVHRISVFCEDLTGDPRIEDDCEPLLVFAAQHTMLIPEEDCPAMVELQLRRKLHHDLSIPTWLLLWSDHQALASLRQDLDRAVRTCLLLNPVKYERVFHLRLFRIGGATEFPVTG